jgi:hypothetical protein
MDMVQFRILLFNTRGIEVVNRTIELGARKRNWKVYFKRQNIKSNLTIECGY